MHLCFVKLEPLSTLSLLLLVLLEQIFLLSSPQCQTLTTTWELPENWVQHAETAINPNFVWQKPKL